MFYKVPYGGKDYVMMRNEMTRRLRNVCNEGLKHLALNHLILAAMGFDKF